MKVVAATLNPNKIEGIEKAFEKFLGSKVKVEGRKVNTDVPEQPIGEDVFKGAENRLKNLEKHEENIYYVSCEGGLIKQYGHWFNVQVVAIQWKGKKSMAMSPALEIPEEYVSEIRKIGLAKFFDRNSKKGGIRVLTNNALKRTDLVEQAILMALAQFNF